MKKKIVAITLLFMLVFSSSVFAETFPTKNNVKPNKIWTVNFNVDMKDVSMNIKNEQNEPVLCVIKIIGQKATITPLFNYTEGEYTLNIVSATSKTGAILKEPVDMKFIVVK